MQKNSKIFCIYHLIELCCKIYFESDLKIAIILQILSLKEYLQKANKYVSMKIYTIPLLFLML